MRNRTVNNRERGEPILLPIANPDRFDFRSEGRALERQSAGEAQNHESVIRDKDNSRDPVVVQLRKFAFQSRK